MAISNAVYKQVKVGGKDDGKDWLGYTERGLLWEEAAKSTEPFIVTYKIAFIQTLTGGAA